MKICLIIISFIWVYSSYAANEFTYKGTCDASAAVPVGSNYFLVANDEDDVLHLYKINNPNIIETFDLTESLQEDGKEADIEGATQVDDTPITYWIASHGRNEDGKFRSDRYRLFGLQINRNSTEEIEVTMIGTPYKNLVSDLLDKDRWEEPDPEVIDALEKATQLTKKKVENLAPKVDGLNIEGLASSPDAEALLIGFRNPLIDGKALIVSLLNPKEILAGESRAKFGRASLVDLNGLGVRSIEYSLMHGIYFIVAGPKDSTSDSYLAIWNGGMNQYPVMLRGLDGVEGVNPESLVLYRETRNLYIFFDEGARLLGNTECKDGDNKTFTGRNISLTKKP